MLSADVRRVCNHETARARPSPHHRIVRPVTKVRRILFIFRFSLFSISEGLFPEMGLLFVYHCLA